MTIYIICPTCQNLVPVRIRDRGHPLGLEIDVADDTCTCPSYPSNQGSRIVDAALKIYEERS